MRAGRLRMRGVIERQTETRSSSGAMTTGWALFADKVPADIESVNGREFFQGAQEHREVDSKITIRYLAGIDATMRFRHDDVIYDIKAILPDSTRRRYLILMCASGVNQG